MSVSTPFHALPRTEGQWLVAASKAGVENTSLLGFPHHRSASKITKAQFLSFRTIIISHDAEEFDPASWQLDRKVTTARNELEYDGDFISLLNAIHNPNALEPTGKFSQLREMHKEISKPIDRNYPEKLQSSDESPVNTSLIYLLNGLTKVKPGALGVWRYTKVRFEASFGTLPGGITRGMVAISDGQLQSILTHEVWAIVECKSLRITPTSTSVLMQEAGLFIAWMKEYQTYPTQRVLVSQDGLHLFITFAEIAPEWLNFLRRNRTSGPRSFLRLHRFGPWDLGRADHVKEVAAILLAITR